jgi:NarL family two-component system response regulator LiaR
MIRILIVDDHEMIRFGLQRWLEVEPDLEVVGAVGGGAAAIEEAAALLPDVMILDLHLPDMHGLDVIRRLRAASSDLPILVMTGYERRRARAVLEAGANGFLTKMESRDRVLDAVRWAARREEGLWISPAIATELMDSDAQVAKAELTKTELKVLSLINRSTTDIAAALFVSEGTIKNHLTVIYQKIGIPGRAEATQWALRYGLLSDSQ